VSELTESAGQLFRTGRLAPAIEAANAAVRKTPGDLAARILLAELLVFAGNFERADVILEAAGETDPSASLVVAEFRQLLRGEMARRQLRQNGRVPNFLRNPTAAMQGLLAALVALRAGEAEEAAQQALEAERLRARVRGEAGGTDFDDFRDVDDLSAGIFEVLTTTGKYYWIPTEIVLSIEFHPPKRPRDLAWRRATMSVHNGPEGDVYLPALYGIDLAERSDTILLGRATDWREDAPGLVRGLGQRMFLAGDNELSAMELTTLRFHI
jgi:type VI secretion system protein ImpE